jgi:hypothetical protein
LFPFFDSGAEVLGAYLDAILAGANEFDASDIAKVIERRPRPSYEERMAGGDLGGLLRLGHLKLL